jgi:hypothetical protein
LFPVISQVEASVQGGVVFQPGTFDQGDHFFWDLEGVVQAAVDDVLGSRETKFPQGARSLFDFQDLGEGKGIARRFIPIGYVGRMESKP